MGKHKSSSILVQVNKDSVESVMNKSTPPPRGRRMDASAPKVLCPRLRSALTDTLALFFCHDGPLQFTGPVWIILGDMRRGGVCVVVVLARFNLRPADPHLF